MRPEITNATLGEQVLINCATESENEYGVEWQFARNGTGNIIICKGDEVSEDVREKYDCKLSAKLHTLVINSVWFNDTGRYTCVEDGGRGPGADSSLLNVYRK